MKRAILWALSRWFIWDGVQCDTCGGHDTSLSHTTFLGPLPWCNKCQTVARRP